MTTRTVSTPWLMSMSCQLWRCKNKTGSRKRIPGFWLPYDVGPARAFLGPASRVVKGFGRVFEIDQTRGARDIRININILIINNTFI